MSGKYRQLYPGLHFGSLSAGSGNWRVLRGGSFNNNADNARAAYRNNNVTGNRNNENGFRVVVVRRSTPLYFLVCEGLSLSVIRNPRTDKSRDTAYEMSPSSPDSCTLRPGRPVMAQRRASAPP